MNPKQKGILLIIAGTLLGVGVVTSLIFHNIKILISILGGLSIIVSCYILWQEEVKQIGIRLLKGYEIIKPKIRQIGLNISRVISTKKLVSSGLSITVSEQLKPVSYGIMFIQLILSLGLIVLGGWIYFDFTSYDDYYVYHMSYLFVIISFGLLGIIFTILGKICSRADYFGGAMRGVGIWHISLLMYGIVALLYHIFDRSSIRNYASRFEVFQSVGIIYIILFLISLYMFRQSRKTSRNPSYSVSLITMIIGCIVFSVTSLMDIKINIESILYQFGIL